MADAWTADESNATSTAAPRMRDVYLAAVEVSVLATVFGLTVIGNVIVLVVLIGGGRKLTRMTVMIVHLSSADLFVAFFNVLPQLSWKLAGNFHGNDLLCRSVVYMWLVAMFGSSYVLVATAVDRYLAICRPLTAYAWTGDNSKYLVGMAWALSLLFALPQLGVFGYQPMDAYSAGTYNCWAVFRPSWTMQVYVTWSTLAIYVIPAAILAGTYGRICYTVWTNTRLKERTSQQSIGTTTSTSLRSDKVKVKVAETQPTVTRIGRLFRHLPLVARSAENAPRGDDRKKLSLAEQKSLKVVAQRSHEKIMTKAKIRTVKLTLAVNVSYIVCWGPFFICQVWSAYDENAPYEGPVMTVLLLLASLNSCTNPWIYIVFVDNIRVAVARLFFRIFCTICTTTNSPDSINSIRRSEPTHPPPPPPPTPLSPPLRAMPHRTPVPFVTHD